VDVKRFEKEKDNLMQLSLRFLEVSKQIPTLTVWDKVMDLIFLYRVFLDLLEKRGIVTPREKKELQNKSANLSYWTMINSPHIQDNEKIKKEIEIICLNDFLANIGFSKDVRFFNSI